MPKHTKNAGLPCPVEDDEQIALFEWAALNLGRYPEIEYLYHIPNGKYRTIFEATLLKKMGVKNGVSDIHLPVPRGQYHGMWVELKRARGGRLEQDQRIWLSAMKRLGYYCVCCEGWQEAAEYIEAYLGDRLSP